MLPISYSAINTPAILGLSESVNQKSPLGLQFVLAFESGFSLLNIHTG
jgi:hypothetical protein